MLDDGELHFMYDSAYDDIKFGTIHGLTPYYNKLLNQFFRYTLSPKVVTQTTSPTYPRICLLGWFPTRMSLVSLTLFRRKSSSALFHQRKTVTMHRTSLP
jgi:hypothetical protein